MKYDNFQVVICSDGLPIPEYHTVTEPKLQSCFIPSEIKRVSTVAFYTPPPQPNVSAYLYNIRLTSVLLSMSQIYPKTGMSKLESISTVVFSREQLSSP